MLYGYENCFITGSKFFNVLSKCVVYNCKGEMISIIAWCIIERRGRNPLSMNSEQKCNAQQLWSSTLSLTSVTLLETAINKSKAIGEIVQIFIDRLFSPSLNHMRA